MFTKRTYPFCPGTTSFVLPDYVLPNVEWLAGKVDHVQLLLIEPEGDLPDSADIARMQEIAQLYDLSYAVHLPTIDLLSATNNRKTVDDIIKLIELARPVDPQGWVVHINPDPPTEADELERWLEQATSSLLRIVSTTGIATKRLEVENQLATDLAAHKQVVNASGCSLCLDLGHVLFAGGDPFIALEDCLPVTSHIHLHGVAERDHCSLEHFPELKRLIAMLCTHAFSGLLTIEVFGKEAFERSLAAMVQSWPATS